MVTLYFAYHNLLGYPIGARAQGRKGASSIIGQLAGNLIYFDYNSSETRCDISLFNINFKDNDIVQPL